MLTYNSCDELMKSAKFHREPGRYRPRPVESGEEGLGYHLLQAVAEILEKPLRDHFPVEGAGSWTAEKLNELYVRTGPNLYSVPGWLNDCQTSLLREHTDAKVLDDPVKSYQDRINQAAFGKEHQAELCYVIGCPGVGKSTLFSYLVHILIPKLNRKHKSQRDEMNREPMPLSVGMTHFLGYTRDESCDNDSEYNRVKLRMIRTLESALGIASPNEVDDAGGMQRYFDEMESRIDNISDALVGKTLIWIVDDVDFFGNAQQENDIAHATRELYTTISHRVRNRNPDGRSALISVIGLRRNTFSRLFNQHRLVKVHASREILVPPPLGIVIKKRLDRINAIVRESQNNPTPGQKVSVEVRGKLANNSYHFKIKATDAVDILRWFIDSLSSDAQEFLHYLTLGNLRSQVLLLLGMLKDVSFSESRLVRQLIMQRFPVPSDISTNKSAGNQIALHHLILALRGIPSGNLGLNDNLCLDTPFSNHFAEHESVIQRNEWWETNRSWSNYLIKLRLMTILHQVQNDVHGHAPSVNDLCLMMEKIGYRKEHVIRALRSFSVNRIIEESDSFLRSHITENNSLKIHLSTGGSYIFTTLTWETSFASYMMVDSPLTFNAEEVERHNHFMPPVKFVDMMRAMEEMEDVACPPDGREKLNELRVYASESANIRSNEAKRKTMSWECLATNYTEIMTRISNYLGSIRGYSKLLPDVQSAITTLGMVMSRAPIAKVHEGQALRLPPAPPITPGHPCHSCLLEIWEAIGLSERGIAGVDLKNFKNPHSTRPYRLEWINQVTPEGYYYTIGAEMFYMHAPGDKIAAGGRCDKKRPSDSICKTDGEGCKAANLFRLVPSLVGIEPTVAMVALDAVFLDQQIGFVDSVIEEYGVEFVSVNISRFLHERPDIFDRNHRMSVHQVRNLNIELPEQFDDAEKFTNATAMLINNHNGNPSPPWLLIDDRGSSSARDIAFHLRRGAPGIWRTHTRGLKYDYELFQGSVVKQPVQRTFMQHMGEELLRAHRDELCIIVEGIQFPLHFEFIMQCIASFPSEAPYPGNLLIQGHGLQQYVHRDKPRHLLDDFTKADLVEMLERWSQEPKDRVDAWLEMDRQELIREALSLPRSTVGRTMKMEENTRTASLFE